MAGQRVELPAYSMFVRTPVYEVGTDVVFGQLNPAVLPNPSDMVFVVPPVGVHRLDLIATQFYGVPDLWWLIASVNGIADPLVSVPAGTRIRIPTRDRLASEGVLSV